MLRLTVVLSAISVVLAKDRVRTVRRRGRFISDRLDLGKNLVNCWEIATGLDEVAPAAEHQFVEILDNDAFVIVGLVHASLPRANGLGDFDVFQDCYVSRAKCCPHRKGVRTGRARASAE